MPNISQYGRILRGRGFNSKITRIRKKVEYQRENGNRLFLKPDGSKWDQYHFGITEVLTQRLLINSFKKLAGLGKVATFNENLINSAIIGNINARLAGNYDFTKGSFIFSKHILEQTTFPRQTSRTPLNQFFRQMMDYIGFLKESTSDRIFYISGMNRFLIYDPARKANVNYDYSSLTHPAEFLNKFVFLSRYQNNNLVGWMTPYGLDPFGFLPNVADTAYEGVPSVYNGGIDPTDLTGTTTSGGRGSNERLAQYSNRGTFSSELLSLFADPLQLNRVIRPVWVGIMLNNELKYVSKAYISGALAKNDLTSYDMYVWAIDFALNVDQSFKYVGSGKLPTAEDLASQWLSVIIYGQNLPDDISDPEKDFYVKIRSSSRSRVELQQDLVKIVANRRIIFDMRYTNDINEGDTIRFENREYVVEDIQSVGREKYLTITALEV